MSFGYTIAHTICTYVRTYYVHNTALKHYTSNKSEYCVCEHANSSVGAVLFRVRVTYN